MCVFAGEVLLFILNVSTRIHTPLMATTTSADINNGASVCEFEQAKAGRAVMMMMILTHGVLEGLRLHYQVDA